MAPSLHGRIVWLDRQCKAEYTQLAENGARHRLELRLKPLDVEKQLLEGEGSAIQCCKLSSSRDGASGYARVFMKRKVEYNSLCL